MWSMKFNENVKTSYPEILFQLYNIINGIQLFFQSILGVRRLFICKSQLNFVNIYFRTVQITWNLHFNTTLIIVLDC